MLSAIAGVLSWGEKGVAASKETRNLMKKEIKGVICIYLVEQSSEALLLIRRFELHILEYWEAGGSLQTCFEAAICMVTEHFYSITICQRIELFFLHHLKLDTQKGKWPAACRSLFLWGNIILKSSYFLPELFILPLCTGVWLWVSLVLTVTVCSSCVVGFINFLL